jgi:hypothetical protein
MPFQRNGKRNYKAELQWEKENKPNRVKDRAARNSARSEMEKKGLVKKGDNKQVDHKKPLVEGGSKSTRNLRVVSDKTNLTKEANRKKRAAKK